MGFFSLWRTLILFSFFVTHLTSQDPNTDSFHLSNFFTAMQPQQHNSSQPHTSSLCSYPGVVCTSRKDSILRISASGSNLTGPIPENTIGKLKKLRSLDLSNNRITSLPSDFWSLDSLKSLNLSFNAISTSLPNNIGNFKSLEILDLSYNSFSGEIPAAISSLVSLTTLNLNNNEFQFGIPPGLLRCKSLLSVDLSSNRLTGSLPDGFGSAFRLKSLNLSKNLLQGSLVGVLNENIETVDLSENRFDGRITDTLSSFLKLGYLNLACNRFDTQEFPEIGDLSVLYYLNLSKTNLVDTIPSVLSRHLKVLDLSFNNLTGNVPMLSLDSIEILDLSSNKLDGEIPKPVLEKLPTMQRFNFSFNNLTFCNPNFSQGMIQTYFIGSTNNCPFAAKPIKGTKKVSKKKTGLKIGLALAISMGFLVFALFLLLVVLRGRKRTKQEVIDNTEPNFLERNDSSVVMIDKPLMKVTFADLKVATLNFDKSVLLSESKSGPTYKAVLPCGFRATLKVVTSGGSALTDFEASTVFERLARINHPNLIPLCGYCISAEQRIAIYEDLDMFSLERLIHYGDESISWRLRHKVALGTARALAFLHHGCIPPVVHGEVKASTVWLDSSQEPLLADFGLAKFLDGLDDSPTEESDVYGFGIVLLELVSGKKPDGDLVDWVRGLVRERQGWRAMDTKMGESVPVEQVTEAVKIGYLCTADNPSKRPTMQQVVGLLKDISPNN